MRPPCVPQLGLRGWRARFSVIAFIATLALIIASVSFSQSTLLGINSLDPGPLSSAHAGFKETRECGACHAAHQLTSVDEWLGAAFSSNDQSGKCLQCHVFNDAQNIYDFEELNRDGHVGLAFDRSPSEERSVALSDRHAPRCAACHEEHRGQSESLATVDDQVCRNCHVRAHPEGSTYRVNEFPAAHPEFDAFPHEVPNSVRFDHNKHLKEYFDPDSKWMKEKHRDPEFARLAASDCTQCHDTTQAGQDVPPKTYAQTCARCHDRQIQTRPFELFNLEELTVFASILLRLNGEVDDDEATRAVRRMLLLIDQNGPDELEQLAGKQPEESSDLFLGLPEIALKQAATAWIAGDDLALTEHPVSGAGIWRLGENDDGIQAIEYVARGHSDRVLASWMTVVRNRIELSEPGAQMATATDALTVMLDQDEGPGACGKCHSSGIDPRASWPGDPTLGENERATAVKWGYRASKNRPYTRFSHQPHIDVLGDDACSVCHQLRESDYSAYFEAWLGDSNVERTAAPDNENKAVFISNFAAISTKDCAKCHQPKRVVNSCQQCHRYHLTGAYKKNVSIPNKGHPDSPRPAKPAPQ
ncbi:MAG: hypothetical protein K0U93_29740 [Gammaproteobacteria bacterium]|nr:hypothetical protein [Gammaproteobacteria bacterium]